MQAVPKEAEGLRPQHEPQVLACREAGGCVSILLRPTRHRILLENFDAGTRYVPGEAFSSKTTDHQSAHGSTLINSHLDKLRMFTAGVRREQRRSATRAAAECGARRGGVLQRSASEAECGRGGLRGKRTGLRYRTPGQKSRTPAPPDRTPVPDSGRAPAGVRWSMSGVRPRCDRTPVAKSGRHEADSGTVVRLCGLVSLCGLVPGPFLRPGFCQTLLSLARVWVCTDPDPPNPNIGKSRPQPPFAKHGGKSPGTSKRSGSVQDPDPPFWA